MSLTNEQLLARRNKVVPRGVFNVAPLFVDKAVNALITDVEGNEYIDFAAGIGVVNVGHCHPRLVEAVSGQAHKLLHSCFHIVMYEQYVALAELLVQATPGDFPKMCALFNSGAEAVENAVKIARHATGRQAVIAFENGFHGRTLLALSLTSKVKPYKFGFGPFAPEIHRMPYAYCYRCPLHLEYPGCGVACADLLRDFCIGHVAAENVACLVVEPVMGEGGFIAPPPEYFPRLKAICEEFGIVFVADEVQSGFGRTGRMFAMEHYGVEPDLVIMAKGMGGGMPISAVAGRAELMDHPQVGGLGGTYGGNPLSCASALAVLEVFEQERVLDKAQALGERMRARFDQWKERFPCVGDVRGLGPMLALELVEERETKQPAPDLAKALVRRAQQLGLILIACGTFGNVIRVLPPLTIDELTLEQGLAIMEQALAELSGGAGGA